MPHYLRRRDPGQSYFFTVRAARQGTDLFVREVDLLRRVTRQTRDRYPFEIDEIVVLDDVIHTIWNLPDGDSDFGKRWRMLKSLFSRALPAPEGLEMRRLRQGEKGIWQRRFWEHMIRDADDLAAHRHMILTAPVQAGLVNRPEEWPYSSVHRAIARGTYPRHAPVGLGYAPYLPRRTTGTPYATTP